MSAKQTDPITHARQRARERDALSRITASFTSDHPAEATMDAIALAVLDATGAHACEVMIRDATSGRLEIAAGAGFPEGYREAATATPSAVLQVFSTAAVASGQISMLHHVRRQMLEHPDYAPLYPFLAGATWDTVIVVPVRYQGRPVGSLHVYYPAGQLPEADEQQFLQVAAGLAAMAAEHGRFHREADRAAREHETLSRAAARWRFDLPHEQPFHALAEQIVAGSDAIACAIFLREADTGNPRVAGAFGLPDGYPADVQAAWRADAGGAMQQTLDDGAPRVLRDARRQMLAEPRYAPTHRYWMNAGWDTVTFVALRHQGRVLGVLCCYYPRGREPDAAELSLLTAVADQASVAVENARLFAHSERRVRELEALAHIASNFTFQQPLESMMDAVASQIVQASGSALGCMVGLADPETRLVARVVGGHGLPPGYREALERAWRTGGTPLVSSSLHRRDTQIIDLATLPWQASYQAVRALQEDAGWGVVTVVPMIYREAALGLVIAAYPAGQPPDGAECSFLAAIADQAAVAVENARLFEQAQLHAVTEERQRISRELHDSVSQALYGISLGAQTARELLDRDPAKAIEPVEYVLALAEAGLAEMRALIFELRPEALATEGLLGALQKQAASLRSRHALVVETAFGDEPDLPLASKEMLYRIAQEALYNVVKHAGASVVSIVLSAEADDLSLAITDNGRGFEVAGDFPGHLGLTSMRERARRAGGAVTITSSPGAGCTVRVTLPAEG